jgi:hypothetical protein
MYLCVQACSYHSAIPFALGLVLINC